jgi:hypothetical protein
LGEWVTDTPWSRLTKIKISPSALGLHWPLLETDLYVPQLTEGAFGSWRWMQQSRDFEKFQSGQADTGSRTSVQFRGIQYWGAVEAIAGGL